MPCGKDKQFQLSLIARGNPTEARQFVERIEPEARLRVGQRAPRLYGEPEIRELVGKETAARHILLLQVAGAHYQGIRHLLRSLDKEGDVLGEVLSVAIDGDGIVVAQLQSTPESCNEGITLALVQMAVNDINRCVAHLSQLLTGIVGTPIYHQDDLIGDEQDASEHVNNRSTVVIGRHNNADVLEDSYPDPRLRSDTYGHKYYECRQLQEE